MSSRRPLQPFAHVSLSFPDFLGYFNLRNPVFPASRASRQKWCKRLVVNRRTEALPRFGHLDELHLEFAISTDASSHFAVRRQEMKCPSRSRQRHFDMRDAESHCCGSESIMRSIDLRLMRPAFKSSATAVTMRVRSSIFERGVSTVRYPFDSK